MQSFILRFMQTSVTSRKTRLPLLCQTISGGCTFEKLIESLQNMPLLGSYPLNNCIDTDLFFQSQLKIQRKAVSKGGSMFQTIDSSMLHEIRDADSRLYVAISIIVPLFHLYWLVKEKFINARINFSREWKLLTSSFQG